MPFVSDVAKVPLTAYSMSRAFAAGDLKGGFANMGMLMGQMAWAGGKWKLGGSGPGKSNPAFKQEMYLLELGVQVVGMLEALHGGASDKGQSFKLASKDWMLAYDSLGNATASDATRWSGDSTDAYNERNQEQMDRATTMSDLDAQIASILGKEAGQVKASKLNLLYCRASITVAIPLAVAINASQGKAASYAFQFMVFTHVMTAVSFIIAEFIKRVNSNANNINQVMSNYAGVASGAKTTLTTDLSG